MLKRYNNLWNKCSIKARKFQRFAESKACWNLSQRLSDLSLSLISNSVDFGYDAIFTILASIQNWHIYTFYIKTSLAGRPQVTTIALSNTFSDRKDLTVHFINHGEKRGKVAVFSVGNKMKEDRFSEWVSERMVVQRARMCLWWNIRRGGGWGGAGATGDT